MRFVLLMFPALRLAESNCGLNWIKTGSGGAAGKAAALLSVGLVHVRDLLFLPIRAHGNVII